MPVIAYMLTLTTYGTWLQGDHRGWVKNGKIHTPDLVLETINRRQMRYHKIILSTKQRHLVAQALLTVSNHLQQNIFALAVCENHVHLVLNNIVTPIGRVASHYKNAARLVVQDNGFYGKLWTKGFDKRYCMNNDEIETKIAYIRKHEKLNATIIIP